VSVTSDDNDDKRISLEEGGNIGGGKEVVELDGTIDEYNMICS
jgi:hypothetical protein